MLKLIMKLFPSMKPAVVKPPSLADWTPDRNPDPVCHDYRDRRWGHDYTFEPRSDLRFAKMNGWGRGLAPGDTILLPLNNGSAAIYEITNIGYYYEPSDMWRADVRHIAAAVRECEFCGHADGHFFCEFNEESDHICMVRLCKNCLKKDNGLEVCPNHTTAIRNLKLVL